jgi:hypothetical protein
MRTINYNNGVGDMYGIAIWLISFLILIVGFRYIKEIIEVVLVKLYEIFIQHNATVVSQIYSLSLLCFIISFV